ncbi:L-cysteine desulfidase family protein [Vagococcus vulneris]|uniref:UPF0597 protein CBF37_03535 n=1 Tax=Vagococcus vulneris TaxID=1977869 RepID=A0A430A0E4_9ENTE|nr:L-serine ammonia-lyase, iron-sulfur-dependent, subunit alpha [Vagococcus vulneris]RST99810.1 hypothetical protein CBF37_03535 [Vagococcus vulneris]
MPISNQSQFFIDVLKDGVVPATGCTEPVAVAFAAATCLDYLDTTAIKKIEVEVSPNIMKNAMAVIVPGTGEPGLKIAAAAGAISGVASSGLGVITDLPESDVESIKELANSDIISTKIADVEDNLFVHVTISDEIDTVSVWIAGSHTNIFLIEKNDVPLFEGSRPDAHTTSPLKEQLQKCSLEEIWHFATTEPLSNISFVLQAANFNMALAEDGLVNDYGLALGKSMHKASSINFGTPANTDLSAKIITYTAAASDARMGGAQLPAMSNSGSGNQGITATVPVCITADFCSASEEQLIRALCLSHLTALYIHSFLPVLSAYCATNSAAMGSAAGICYLMNGDYATTARAVNNMIGDAPGVICDGAGCSCAMKVASAVSSLYRAANLALRSIEIPSSNGIVSASVDDSIRNLGHLVTHGLKETDRTILNVMLAK